MEELHNYYSQPKYINLSKLTRIQHHNKGSALFGRGEGQKIWNLNQKFNADDDERNKKATLFVLPHKLLRLKFMLSRP